MSEPEQAGEKPLRLTKDVRQALLDANEGFTDSSYWSDKNFTEARQYEITDGELHVHSNSNGSWAASRRTDDFVADEAATHRFLNKNLHRLETDGVAEEAAAARSARRAAEKAEREIADEAPVVVSSLVHDSKRVQPTNTAVNKALAVATIVVTVIWVAPHVKNAWETKAKPRVEAWRARRAAASADPLGQDDEAQQPVERPNNPD